MQDQLSPIVVLVVDDEPLVRMYAVDMLEDAGFIVLEADNGEDAMAMIAGHPEVGVLFTDIHMPGPFDGLVLARKVHEVRPDVQLIIASGRGHPAKGELPAEGRFFMKPYDGAAVASLIRSTHQISRSLAD